MPEIPANPNIAPSEYPRRLFRFFEILPGAFVWSILIAPFVLSLINPAFVAIFVLVFDLYWLIKALSYGAILLYGYRKLSQTLTADWYQELKSITPPHAPKEALDWRELYHAIIITTFRESKTTLDASIRSILDTGYPKNKLILVLACEERDQATSLPIAQELLKTYDKQFAHSFYTIHPDGIVGEVKAKGANVTWAAKQLVQFASQKQLSRGRIIVSTADADSRFSKHYFARLSYVYAITPDRIQCSFQPVAMYFNNIWDAPMFSRVLAFGTTFWQMIESIRDYRLITFATHATSLQTLYEMDYWCTSIVNEDSRQFFRGYFHYKGHFRVVPLFMPIYMDAVHSGNLRSSMRNLYLQQQRWAYGVEHFPYIVLESMRQHTIPLSSRLTVVWRAFEGAFSWATASYFITFVGWIPFLLNDSFQQTIIAHNFQFITRNILTLTWLGLFISIYLTLRLMPPLPHHKHKVSVVLMGIQWITIPIAAIFFGSLPAIDAQTRLMLGKYIGFRVTEKAPASLKQVGVT